MSYAHQQWRKPWSCSLRDKRRVFCRRGLACKTPLLIPVFGAYFRKSKRVNLNAYDD